MYTTLYAFFALPVLYGLVYLFGVVRIYRHEPLLGVLSFLFVPVGVYATVRYWRAEDDNPRVPVLASLAVLGIWLGMLAFGASDEPAPIEGAEYVELEGDAGQEPADEGLRVAVTFANLPYRSGTIDVPEAQARIDVPTHFRFVSAQALRAAGVDADGMPHASAVGWLVHESVELARADAWFIEVDWFGEGFVSSERMTAYGNVALLAEARATAAKLAELDASEQVELVGFAGPPVFDVSEARLTWAEEVEYAGERSLDCHAVKLGRGGALMLSIGAMSPQRGELCLLSVRLAAGSSRFNPNHAFTDYSRLFDTKSRFDLVDLVTGRHWLPQP